MAKKLGAKFTVKNHAKNGIGVKFTFGVTRDEADKDRILELDFGVKLSEQAIKYGFK